MASMAFRPAYVCNQCIRTLRPQFRAPLPPQFTLTRTLRTGTRSLRRSRGHSASKSPQQKSDLDIVDAFTTPTPSPTTSTPAYIPVPTTRPLKQPKAPKPLTLTDGIHAYWETLEPSLSQRRDADLWFEKAATPQFLRSVAVFRQFPESDVPEVAFVGRSNVGKSSLLNALVNADIKEGLARVSKTPGCTKTLNLYGVGPHDGVRVRKGKNNGHDRIVGIGGLLIVDLPGYGEGSLSEWGTEIMKYLTNRKQLRRVFVLVDAAVGLKEKDKSLLASLRLAGVSHQVLVSKLDKVYLPDSEDMTRFDGKAKNSCYPKGSEKLYLKKMEELKVEVKPPQGAGALGELLSVSSEVEVDGRRLGLDAVRVAVLQAAGVSFEEKHKKDKKKAKKAAKKEKAAENPTPEVYVPKVWEEPTAKTTTKTTKTSVLQSIGSKFRKNAQLPLRGSDRSHSGATKSWEAPMERNSKSFGSPRALDNLRGNAKRPTSSSGYKSQSGASRSWEAPAGKKSASFAPRKEAKDFRGHAKGSSRGSGDKAHSTRGAGDRTQSTRGFGDRTQSTRGSGDRSQSTRGSGDRSQSTRGPGDRTSSRPSKSWEAPAGKKKPFVARKEASESKGGVKRPMRGPGDRGRPGGPRQPPRRQTA